MGVELYLPPFNTVSADRRGFWCGGEHTIWYQAVQAPTLPSQMLDHLDQGFLVGGSRFSSATLPAGDMDTTARLEVLLPIAPLPLRDGWRLWVGCLFQTVVAAPASQAGWITGRAYIGP